MSKKKSKFVCQECGYESSGWLGKCPACNSWNTFVEELEVSNTKNTNQSFGSSTPIGINDISFQDEDRYNTNISEMDRVLGGGIVKGSLILVGGDPGIGKSTLLLQICEKCEIEDILYVSGEESLKQIKLRADRLKVKNDKIKMISENCFDTIESTIEAQKPELVIIDSIQTVFLSSIQSAPGSVSQVREVTASLMRIAKVNSIAIIIVGHVTKEGSIAGPRVLEHMVDTVLYFEGDRHLNYRILRAVKNRFGSTNEIGIFEMCGIGLKEVLNPSQMLLEGRPVNQSGSVVTSTLEGSRPMLIEIQALVSYSNFNMPRRMSTGVDNNRITLLIAVLEKKAGLQLGKQDVYVNIIGGIKIDEPACDLGIAAAIASSFKNKVIDETTVLIGEIGLTGEIRTVNQIEKRIMEAKRLGFTKCVIPNGNMKLIEKHRYKEIEFYPVGNNNEVLEIII